MRFQKLKIFVGATLLIFIFTVGSVVAFGFLHDPQIKEVQKVITTTSFTTTVEKKITIEINPKPQVKSSSSSTTSVKPRTTTTVVQTRRTRAS